MIYKSILNLLFIFISSALYAQSLKGLTSMGDELNVIESISTNTEVEIQIDLNTLPTWTENRLLIEHHPTDFPNQQINPVGQLKNAQNLMRDLLWGENPLLQNHLISYQQTLLFKISNHSNMSVRFYTQNIDLLTHPPQILPNQSIEIRGKIRDLKPASYGVVAENQVAQFAGIFLKELISDENNQAGQTKTLKACVIGLNRFYANRAIRNLESFPWKVSCYPRLQAPIPTQALPVLDSSDHHNTDMNLPTDMGIMDMGTHIEPTEQASLPFKPAPLAPNFIVWPNENIQLLNVSTFPLIIKAQQSTALLELRGENRIDALNDQLNANEYMILPQDSATIRHPMPIEQTLLTALPYSTQGQNAWFRQRPFLRLITLNRYNTELSQGIFQQQSNQPIVVMPWIKPSFQWEEGSSVEQSDVDMIYQGSPRSAKFLISYVSYPEPLNVSPKTSISINLSNLSPLSLPFEVEGHDFYLLEYQGKKLNPRLKVNQIDLGNRHTARIMIEPRYYPLKIGALSLPEGDQAFVLLQ